MGESVERRRDDGPEFAAGTVLPDDLPMSEGVRIGRLLFLSGQIGVEPGTLSLVSGGVRAETEGALDNVGAVLGALKR